MNLEIGVPVTVLRMFEKFLFCFKQKAGAVLMAYTSMVSGIIGMVYFLAKVHLDYAEADSHFLVISVFHVLVSAILIAAVVWEKPLLVLVYEFLHLSVLVCLLFYAIVYNQHCASFWVILGSCIAVAVYWMSCIHMYQRQLRLKLKSHLDYINGDAYSLCS
uniref:MARVEL domain-containing protein n=1 Tax=Dendroctonus ponderosae TaxID=77166 RepID=A0AAR5Q1M3_DENPD